MLRCSRLFPLSRHFTTTTITSTRGFSSSTVLLQEKTTSYEALVQDKLQELKEQFNGDTTSKEFEEEASKVASKVRLELLQKERSANITGYASQSNDSSGSSSNGSKGGGFTVNRHGY